MAAAGFLEPPEITSDAQRIFDDDLHDLGYVMNLTRLWAHQPASLRGLFELLGQVNAETKLSFRERGILVVACASAYGDSYCPLAWGRKLADAGDPDLAVAVVRGTDEGLTASERAMARWARKVARDPARTTEADVEELRAVGFDDAQIFTMTVFVALRLAFATVNDALGALPDARLRTTAPPAVLDAVTFGRPIEQPSP